jgi:hypothetical protein
MKNISIQRFIALIFRLVFLPVFISLLAEYQCYSAPNLLFQPLKKCLFVNPPQASALLKAESNDLKSLRNSLFISGINFDEITSDKLLANKLTGYDLLIIPVATAKNLSLKQISTLKDALYSGVNLLFDGVSKLNEALAITLQKESIEVNQIHDLQFPSTQLYWTHQANVKPVDVSGKNYKILCIEDSTDMPIVISSSAGKGKFVYFSTYFDPYTTKGYSRFPFLIETLKAEFGIQVLAERKTVEMYFDPGMRDTMKIEDLVQYWSKNKIKRIHAGGWYYDQDFDYAKLIKTCHENGILIYCWLEMPMISRTFWDKHPEWREKTVFNKDANIDWRLLMNLADSNCREQIFKELGGFLSSHDFDGVNFAELYFEPSPVGPNLPENFTPMNQLVRSQFKKQSGFDPVELFDSKSPHYWKKSPTDWKTFANYRKNLCFQLKDDFLGFLTKIKKQKKDYEIMLTVLDVSLTPELSDFIAEDTRNSMKLYEKYGVTMQIEDPSNCWGLTPERYVKMGNFYRKQIKEPNKLLFDCNVVASHEMGEGGFPAEKPTGEEIRQITYNMSTHINRPVFYSEDAINKNDWLNISNTLARNTKITALRPDAWTIEASNTVILHTGIQVAILTLDGRPWYACESDGAIIPKGKHTLEINQAPTINPLTKIVKISGELVSAYFRQDEIEISYSEDIVSCYVTIDKLPVSIFLDGQKTDCQVFQNLNSEFTVRLPAGKHKVRIL